MLTELPQRTSVSGPALVRLLSRLAQAEVKGPEAPLAVSLNEWLGWSESIVLSTALNATMPGTSRRNSAESRAGGSVERTDEATGEINEIEIANAEYVQVRQSLQEAIRAAVAPPAPASDLRRRQMRGAPRSQAEVDFPSHRRRYSLVQQKMESSISTLRGRLRARLAERSPRMARLAAVDAAMEQALAEHESRLLAGIPNLLERRFASLIQAGQSSGLGDDELSKANGVATPGTPPGDKAAQSRSPGQAGSSSLLDAQLKSRLKAAPWLDVFRDDMRSVLLAELDVRLQPIEGLLSALRVE